jgi:hypothetical protein
LISPAPANSIGHAIKEVAALRKNIVKVKKLLARLREAPLPRPSTGIDPAARVLLPIRRPTGL